MAQEVNVHPLVYRMPNVQQKQRNSRVQKYLSLVQPIAKRYAHRSGCDCDDLIQVGCLGLIQASQRFEQTKGTVFHVFAKPHIRGAILHYLRDRASLIRLPRHVEERAILLKEENEQALNNSDRLILQHYKFKTKWVELNEECLMGKYDEIINMEWKEQNSRINSARQTLAEDQQNIIQLVIVEGNSLRKAGKIVGVSAMTVQRRLKQALAQLRELLTADQSG
jgi:RNA polymerase sigma-B factor